MAEAGLSLRDIKRQERLEKRGGGLGRLPPRFWERAGELRDRLQRALRECGPTDSSRYHDLHEDLKRLEGLLREITVNRERKLLLAAHEAVSGLSPEVNHMEVREKPLFEDLKQVLETHRQRVFTGPALPEAVPPSPAEVQAGPKPESPQPQAEPATPPTLPSTPEPSESPPAPPTSEPAPPAPPAPPAQAGEERAPAPSTPAPAKPEEEPPAPQAEVEPETEAKPTGPTGLPAPGSYQLVRVLEEVQPFTAIDARVYTLKAQEVVTLPTFNARRLAEVGVVVPIEGLASPTGKPTGKAATTSTSAGG